MRPQAGELAPDFELQTDEGRTFRLADFRGKRVVLFFYPRADTPGCIKEACGFRDDYLAYQDQNTVVLGISPDTVRAQSRFRARYRFPYPLLPTPITGWRKPTEFGRASSFSASRTREWPAPRS